MIQEEFEHLKALFRAAAEGSQVNINAIFQQSLHFFEELKKQLESDSIEDKEEAIELMRQMYEQMVVDTQKIVERSGLSAEQLSSFADNPTNFSKDEWNALQASKEQIQEVGENLSKASQTIGKEEARPLPTPRDSKSANKKLRGKKTNWMRS